MHTQVTAPPELRAMSDAEMSEAWAAGAVTVADLEAEVARRETAAKIRAASRERNAEWEAAAYANYQAAEAHCRGDANMLSEAGRRTGQAPWPMLWQGGRETADKLASDDLITFWDYTSPRPPSAAEYATARREAAAEQQARNGYGSTGVSEATAKTPAPVRALPKVDPEILATWRQKTAEVRAEHEAKHGRALMRRDDAALERTAPREPIDGAQLLTNVCKWLKRYLYLDSEAKYWALTLWIAGTHFRDEHGELVHEAYGIAGFLSEEPGSGKTHALDLLAILCPNVPGVLIEPSEAAVAILVGKHRATLLLDESDVLFGAGKRKAAIRALLNSGYKQGGTWPRVRKNDVEHTPAYGAKAIAGLSVMKTGTGSSLDALMSRIIEWEMHKPPPGTQLHKLRERFGVAADGTPVTGRSIGVSLNAQMAAWAAQERAALTAMTLDLPEGVELRQEELWAPLLAVAAVAEANRLARGDEAARDTGDNWADLAWEACMDMSLYGGVPDTAQNEADMLASIIDGWD